LHDCALYAFAQLLRVIAAVALYLVHARRQAQDERILLAHQGVASLVGYRQRLFEEPVLRLLPPLFVDFLLSLQLGSRLPRLYVWQCHSIPPSLYSYLRVSALGWLCFSAGEGRYSL